MDKIEGKRILIHCRDKFKVFNLKKLRGRLKSSSQTVDKASVRTTFSHSFFFILIHFSVS